MTQTNFVDPLLECLVILTQLNHRPFSADALRAGLPLPDHQLTPALFTRAAERAGFSARIVKRPLEKISNLVLPVILLLKDNQTCILHKIHSDGTADLSFPESGHGLCQKTLSELAESYTGQTIFMRPIVSLETPNEVASLLPEQGSWFFGTLWRYRYIYIQVILAALFINIFTLIGPLFIMNVYDRVVPNYAETTLWVLSIGVAIIYAFDFILRVLRSYLIDVCGKKADVLMASSIFQHVMGIQMANKPQSVGSFANNLREFESLRDFFTSATLTTLIDIPFAVLFLILIWYLGGFLVLVPLFAVPVVFISAYLIEKPLNATVKQTVQGAAKKNAILVEAIAGLEVIKCMGAEGQLQRKWEQTIARIADFGLRSRFLSTLVMVIGNYSQQMVLIGTVVLGVYLIHASLLTVGGLIACNILANRILAPLAQMTGLLTRYHQAKIALQGLDKIMSLPLERPIHKQFIHRPTLKGSIEFENVSFQYTDQKTMSLDKVSFKINAGERVGIIGRMGSGKSTLQKLLLGLYPPSSGNIRIDGIDLAQIDPADLRRNISYVPQDSLLFSGTARDNIVMAMPWVDDAQVLQAAKIAGVDDFVNKHPHGYNLLIGERGEGLSGGQRQAVAIARAVISNAPFCFFDEPTSSMDNGAEHELIIKLAAYLSQKTLLLVTHKIALFALVDRLILLDHGRLILDGPRDQVIARLSQAPQPKPNSQETNHETK